MIKIVSATILVAIIILIASYFLRDQNQSIINNIETRNSSATVAEIEIIAFGDSLTAGFGIPLEESYPAQLEARLKADNISVKVINAGVSGETTRGNLERAAFIRGQNPDIVLLGIGGNDALRALPIAETYKNMSETIKILKSGADAPLVILLKMQAPLNGGVGYKLEFDKIYERLSQEHRLLLTPFITTEVFLKRENKLPDGIHLNKAGYGQVIDLYLYKTISDVIEKLNN